MLHRLYHCPVTQSLREGQDWDKLKNLPKASVSWGLFKEPAILTEFWKELDAMTPPSFQPLPITHDMVHIFTDGSCSCPRSGRSTERHAAWAFRVAEPNSERSMLISSGSLPGRKQRAYRGELFAVCCALSYARKAKIYSDCKGVCRGFQRLLRLGWEETYWRTSQDLDLWRTGWSLLSQEGRHLEITWIASHRKVSEAHGLRDLWEIANNNQVDKDASFDKHRWPPRIERLHHQVVLANTKEANMKLALTRYIRNVWDQHAAANE